MRVSIMQPYFFPYIGYWQLFFNCDKWVFFDNVQYNKRSWMNRNRILHSDPNKEFQYINVPIKKHDKGTLIKDVAINANENWGKKILGQLTVYRRMRAPYYKDVISLVDSIASGNDELFLSLIIRTADNICSYLDLDVDYVISSTLDIDIEAINEPDDWALNISKALGAEEYVNPYGGAEIFNTDKYQSNGIDIKFMKPIFNTYKQSLRDFIPGLSIIDVLMFNPPTTVRQILKNDYQLLTKSEATREKSE